MTVSETAIKGLEAAIRAAKLALFVINKQGVMPNSSWESGFNADLKIAEDAKAALTAALSDQAETIRACARSTLIGFKDEIGDRNIEFICDQIALKATLDAPDQAGGWQLAPKEPTPAMLRAATGESPKAIWQSMLAEALK
jgi:hypothetical protein